MKYFIFILVLFPKLILSQGTIAISFNESIHLNLFTSKFEFKFKDGRESIKLNDSTINLYTFKSIGQYIISVKSKDHHNHEDECRQVHLLDSLIVYVDSIKMKFDLKSITTSKPIVQNQSTEGIDLYIDVQIDNIIYSKVLMNSSLIHSAGIGTNIVAKLDSNFTYIEPGKHRLKYNLSGICTETSFIQFDFVHHNGKIEPISLPNPVLKN